VKRVRELRKSQTPAEEILWELLRDRQLADLKFRRQHQIGDYIVDFFCAEQRIVIELDGAIHDKRDQTKKDATRQAYLESLGHIVLRFRNEEVLTTPETVFSKITAACSWLPPRPLGEGRGEGKSSGALNAKDKVLMVDARNIYRKVTRKIYDFSPEQTHNLAAIVWLYRGQRERFLGLVKDYLGCVCAESAAVPATLTSFETTLAGLRGRFDALAKAVAKHADLDAEKKQALADAVTELCGAAALYEADAKKLLAGLHAFAQKYAKALPDENKAQHTARKGFDPNAEAIRGLVKQVDLLYKLAVRCADAASALSPFPSPNGRGTGGEGTVAFDMRDTRKQLRNLDDQRHAAVEQLKAAVYFHRQMAWLQDRFPKAELQSVPGLVRLVDRPAIEAADWSLTPGRYVGVAPPEEDEDFDFEQTLRDIHTELADLNKEAVELAAKIQANFEELGV
jgi:type I restriction enzyme M protein